jgi:hypothetical protein
MLIKFQQLRKFLPVTGTLSHCRNVLNFNDTNRQWNKFSEERKNVKIMTAFYTTESTILKDVCCVCCVCVCVCVFSCHHIFSIWELGFSLVYLYGYDSLPNTIPHSHSANVLFDWLFLHLADSTVYCVTQHLSNLRCLKKELMY